MLVLVLVLASMSANRALIYLVYDVDLDFCLFLVAGVALEMVVVGGSTSCGRFQ